MRAIRRSGEQCRHVYRGDRRNHPYDDGVALAVAPGAATGIVGAPGSGRTALVRAVVGLQPVTAGTISLGGVPLSGANREQRRRDWPG
ncbi:ATP-binding cassette domain-containing protein [Streptomyces bobili]|uniref:ATP-binding cassette domain-containing protein n=1 Tax=Streptomyces bobili TaxID=67280 RepID=UPI0037FFAC6B